MEPLEATRLPAWRQVAVGAILAALAGALIWQVSRSPAPLPSNPASIPGAIVLESGETTAPPATGTATTTEAAPPTLESFPEVLGSAEAALAAWGKFAVSGDLSVLDASFDPAGPQYQRLVSESAALQADPLGEPPYTVLLGSAQVEDGGDGRAAVAGTVTFSRAGESPQVFSWRMIFTPLGQGWALWSVQPL